MVHLSAEIENPILEKPNSNVNYVNSTWMKEMMMFMGRYKIKIFIMK